MTQDDSKEVPNMKVVELHELTNLVKICPNLGKFWTRLHGNFSRSSKRYLEIHFKDELYRTFQAFQNIHELLEIILE